MRSASWRVFVGLGLGLCAVACARADIVINGDFEDPPINDSASWEAFTSIPGWHVASGPSFELLRGHFGWQAAQGAQFAELDWGIDVPIDEEPGVPEPSAVYQDLVTEPGVEYELSFSYAHLPGSSDNVLLVNWDGESLVSLGATTPRGIAIAWEDYSCHVQATSTVTRLEFGDGSTTEHLGALIDRVVCVPVPEPGTLVALALTAGAATRRRRP